LFVIQGIHGQPAPLYCQHGLETFPGWHRIYLFEFEKALRKADIENGKDGNIGLPYWDWTDEEVIDAGLPAMVRKRFAKWPADFWPSDVKPEYPLIRSSDAYIEQYIKAWGANTDGYDCLRAV
jgi:hypothetical protein